jgi:hypothetical protein
VVTHGPIVPSSLRGPKTVSASFWDPTFAQHPAHSSKKEADTVFFAMSLFAGIHFGVIFCRRRVAYGPPLLASLGPKNTGGFEFSKKFLKPSLTRTEKRVN